MFLRFLIIVASLLYSISYCYGGTQLDSNLAVWGENQNKYNDIFKKWAEKYGIYPPVIKVLAGQEQQSFLVSPSLPQQSGGPAEGVCQIEDGPPSYTYETIVADPYSKVYKKLSKYKNDAEWKRLENEYLKILLQYNNSFPQSMASDEFKELLKHISTRYPRLNLTPKQYKEKTDGEGNDNFTEVELRQIANDEIELVCAYYTYLLGQGGALILDEGEESAITAAAGYKEGPGTLRQLKMEIVDPDGDRKNIQWSKWANIEWRTELSQAFNTLGIPKSYYDHMKEWLFALTNGITAKILFIKPDSPVKEGEITVRVRTSIGMRDAPVLQYKSASGNTFGAALAKRINNTTFEYTAPVWYCNDGIAEFVKVINPACNNEMSFSGKTSFRIDAKKPEVEKVSPKPKSTVYVDKGSRMGIVS